jgi:methylmalonyl-CoA/ethylmalonyl-CoA epimerase
MAPSIPFADIDLDHVAVAVEHWREAWPRYRGELGGEWVSGGGSIGFAAMQLRYANGMKLEILEPANVEHNDFLRRFLDRNGPGPHHLTFKVKDIAAAMAAAEAAGYPPVNADLQDPGWKEAFLHPKSAPGVVVQLAQSSGTWSSPPPPDLPPAGPPATLLYVAHAVADLDEGLRLFEGLLGGRRLDAGDSAGLRWVELGWQGPGRVRVVQPTDHADVTAWLGGRPGRVLELAFRTDAPAGLVDPQDNLGTRLRLLPA